MLITCKSLEVHGFDTRVCCGNVYLVCVQSDLVGCGGVSFLQVSLCVYCISSLRYSDIGGMADVDKQRVCIKFRMRSGKMGSETVEMLKQTYGDSCMSSSQTPELFGCFKNGRTSTANNRSSQPSTATTPSKVEQVQAAVNQDRRRTIHNCCANVGMGYRSCQQIVTEQLKMHQIAVKIELQGLTHDRKDSRVEICQELKETVRNDPTLLLNDISGDESIVYAYNPETKLQSSQ
jgi:hypothetical protein